MNQYKTTYVYIAACIGIIFFGISFIVMGVVLPSMIFKYNLSELDSSRLVTFLPIGLLMGSLAFGPIVDRFGYKNLLCISPVIVSIGLLGLSTIDNLDIIGVFIFLTGLGGGLLNGSTNALVAEIYEGKQAASKLSILGMCYGVGALCIPLLIRFFSQRYTYETILMWTALVILLSIIYFISIKFPQPKNKQGLSIKDMFKLIRQPVLLLLSFILFFQSGLEGLLNNWSTTYLMSMSIEKGEALFALTALILGITLGRLFLGYLITAVRSEYVLLGGLGFLIIGIGILDNTYSFWKGAIALFIIGIGLAGVFPIVIGIIGSVHRKMTGTAVSIAMAIALSGNSILNYVMGFISEQYKIAVFPKFLLVCVILQATLMLIGRKYLVNK